MARILDNAGRPLGGLELSFAELLAPLNSMESAPIQSPDKIIPPIYGPDEDVLRLVCSFGTLPILVFSASGMTGNRDSQPADCQNQIDKPHKRHYCTDCGGYYCVTHAATSAHACASVFRE